MVLKAVSKALKKADKLKEKIQLNSDLLNNETWLTQQQLQRIYQQVLILDLEFALDKKVEQDLWNHGFKNFIVNLQNIAKDKKNPKHSESQAMLYWCLEAASGFYLTLLHEICSAFDLDLPFRRNNNLFGCSKSNTSVYNYCFPNKSSCYYICQHCLVHLGDIARYKNRNRQAEVFYRYAVQLSPNSGQPYNQLAILEASRGDKLSTVYHYVRSIALRHPFPVAFTNLSRTLNKHADEFIKLEGHNKLSSYEYVSTFLKLHGLLHSNTELDTAENLVQILATSLTAHIATESLSSWKLVQIVTINIFALHSAKGSVTKKKKLVSNNELTVADLKIRTLIIDFLAACLTAFLLPVYTIKSGERLLDYFTMPAVKLIFEWIKQEPDVLEKASFKNRLQIWPSLCKLLNDLQPVLTNFPAKNYTHVPLPEDRDLQGFLPFEKSFQNLKFHTEDLKIDLLALNKLRASRLVEFGIWLSEQERLNILNCSKQLVLSNNTKVITFETACRQELLSGEQIKEFEEMIMTNFPSPTPSEASGSVTRASTPDSSLFQNTLTIPLTKFKGTDFSSQENLQEKRPGILKCQNSCEKKEKILKSSTLMNRNHRNVALQAIMNKNTEETRQVTFKTPSPTQDVISFHSFKKSNFRNDQKFIKYEELKREKKFLQKTQERENNKNKDQIILNKIHKSDSNLNEQKLLETLNLKEPKKFDKSERENVKSRKTGEISKEIPFSEFMNAFPPLPGVKESLKNVNTWESDSFKEPKKLEENIEEKEKSVSKQHILSELFSDSKALDLEQKQPRNMSGLLNLNKQQQKMLSNSKILKNNFLQQSQYSYQQSPDLQKTYNKLDFSNFQSNIVQSLKCTDKVETDRKDYEGGAFAFQTKLGQETLRQYQGSASESEIGQYDYEKCLNVQQSAIQPQLQQKPNQPHLYVRLNQPLINMGNFGFKYPAHFFLPWQEPQEPPLPPSWWSETPQNYQQSQQIDMDNKSSFQEAYSCNEKSNFEFDWTYQPYPINFPIYIPPPVLETGGEDFHYQMSENYAACAQTGTQESLHTQSNCNVQSVGMGNNSYSLFSTSSWNTIRSADNDPEQNYGFSGGMMTQQSFWSGPGPSPLERLLEQQKQMRKAALDPKNGA